MKAPEVIETTRLLLRKPARGDADAIFRRYASDPEVTRFLSWPRHRSLADTQAFLSWSDADWELWPAGSYLLFARGEGPATLLGGTGLSFRTPTQVVTGYVLARDAWGHGFATEALRAMVNLAARLDVHRLEALCHAEHTASAHVLEKCGFILERTRRNHFIFPNLEPQELSDVLHYARHLQGPFTLLGRTGPKT